MLFCFIFLIEMSAFLAFVDSFGIFFGFFEVLLTFVFGLKLISSRPFVVMQQLQQELAAGGDPREILFGGLRLFIAGFFLVLPGLVSDSIGIWLWLASLLSNKSQPAGQSEWGSDGVNSEPASNEFNDAWQGDEFSDRIKGKVSAVDAGDIVDATIISTDDQDKAEKE